MSKGPACIIIFSICLIALFFIMLYLMTTIDPPPLKGIDVPDLGIIQDEDNHDFEHGADIEHGHKVRLISFSLATA